MKVILYMAITVNGLIAKTNDDTSFTSQAEWDSYSAMIRQAGNVVVGHRTYDILTKQPEFKDLKKVKIIVVSHHTFKLAEANHLVAKSPREALAGLKDFLKVIVAGGSQINTAFLAENLIDEIYLDIEPIVLGRGIPLFASNDYEKKLELIETKNISDNEIQLHYRVVK